MLVTSLRNRYLSATLFMQVSGKYRVNIAIQPRAVPHRLAYRP